MTTAQPERTAVAGEEKPAAESDAFHTAMRALFHPERVAIVGATPKPGFASAIHRNILRHYQGEVVGITPRYPEVFGSPCYPALTDVPGGVDSAILVVPSQIVMEILAQAEQAGVKALNIITSGFGEQADAEAHARQDEIKRFAERTGIRIVGPNCLGLISTPANLIAMSGPYTDIKRGPIAIVFQSGLLTYSVTIPQQDRDFGYSYVITTGNEADLDATDFMRYCVEDDETQVVGCFIEQFRSPEKLREVAQLAAERQKPIVVLKIGRSEAGERAARAHTGSLVGSDAIADAVMRQYGIVRVSSLDEMIETLAVFHSQRLPKGPGVGTIFVSGGAGGMISDLAQDLGVLLPELAPETVAKLQPVIPVYGTVGNPLDTTGQAAQQPEIMQGSLTAMAEDPNIHTIVYGQAFPTRIDLATPVGQVLKAIPERYPDKVFVALALVTGRVAEGRQRDQEPEEPAMAWNGVPFLQGAENGLRAIRALNRYAEFLRQRERGQAGAEKDHERALAARALVRAGGGKPLVERAAKEVLALYGIPVTRERLATTADDAVAAAETIGYPVVLKIESPDIAHKTEAGGVLLDLRDQAAVRDGFARVLANAQHHDPRAQLTGVVVQEQVGRGHELILGMTQDPGFGPAIAVGLGGIFVETLNDVTLGVPPLSARDARSMLARLRAAPVLEGRGSRGAGPADTEAVVEILRRFSQLALDLADDVSEIDINPLVVFEQGQGARVVDCLIVPASPAWSGAEA